MRDILVVLMVSGFFAACVGYIRLCDRIIGPDPEPGPAGEPVARAGEEVGVR
jgi:hypothetical protein